MSRKLFALLGEVEDDPSVLETGDLQQRLTAQLEAVNRSHGGDIYAPLVVSGGFPEFAGVFLTHRPIYDIARVLTDACYPLPVRLALARGEIHTEGEAHDADSMDGPAFDLAGELLYRARKEHRLVLLDTGNTDFDALFNALLLLLHRNFRQWTRRQWEVVRLYRELRRQNLVAERLGISQQSVSSTLAGAGWKTLAEVEDALHRVLGESEEGRPPEALAPLAVGDAGRLS